MAGIQDRPVTKGVGDIEELEWAGDVADAAMTEPTTAQRDTGWAVEKPSYKTWNYFWQRLNQWMRRLSATAFMVESKTATITITATGAVGYVRDLSFDGGAAVGHTTSGTDTTSTIARDWAAGINADPSARAVVRAVYSAGTSFKIISRYPGMDATMVLTDVNGTRTMNVDAPFKVRMSDDDASNASDLDLVFGSTTTENSAASFRSRFQFRKALAAFRAGRATGTQWDLANTGDGSTAFGENNTASGAHSTASGYNNLASGDGSVAMGRNNTASNDDTVAIGNGSEATGAGAIAMGGGAQASGVDSLAAGNGATAGGDNALALGASAQAAGENATAIGLTSNAGGENSLAAGVGANAAGLSSAAIGKDATVGAAGTLGIAGPNATVNAARGVAFGSGATVDGDDGIALGLTAKVEVTAPMGMATSYATASGGEAAFAHGKGAKASARGAIAIGPQSPAGSTGDVRASADGAMATGAPPTNNAYDAIEAAGVASRAHGPGCKANADYSRATGTGAVVNNRGEQAHSAARASVGGQGELQMGSLHVWSKTTGATTPVLTPYTTAGVGATTWTLRADTSYMVTIRVVAYDEGDGHSAAWDIRAHVRRVGATTSVAFTGGTAIMSSSGGTFPGTAAVALVVNSPAIDVQVTGIAGRDIRWSARIDYVSAGA
jgi:hypothetical protein